jgi:hypothetical protein
MVVCPLGVNSFWVAFFLFHYFAICNLLGCWLPSLPNPSKGGALAKTILFLTIDILIFFLLLSLFLFHSPLSLHSFLPLGEARWGFFSPTDFTDFHREICPLPFDFCSFPFAFCFFSHRFYRFSQRNLPFAFAFCFFSHRFYRFSQRNLPFAFCFLLFAICFFSHRFYRFSQI